MPMRTLMLALALTGLAANAAAQAPAASPAAPHLTINIMKGKPPTGRQLTDETTVVAIRKAGDAGGLAAICPRTQELRDVLEHAPPSFPMSEAHGNSLIVRGETPEMAMAMAVLAGVVQHSQNVAVEYDTYPEAALLLGSCENEQKHWEAAIRWLDRGLAMQPDHAFLVSEKAASLEGLHRPADALALVDGLLKKNLPWLAKEPKALLLRNKGFALVELKRLDEGEQAYRESLTQQPGHGGALNELRYIAQLRGGHGPTDVVVVTSDKAQSGDFNPAPQTPPKP